MAAVGVVVLAAAGAAATLVPGDSDDTALIEDMSEVLGSTAPTGTSISTTESEAAPADSTSAPGTPECPETNKGGVRTGSGPGGFASGPDAIFGFDHAYYVERSGNRAREFTTPDATSPGTAEVIQRGIDGLPSNTRHCLTVTDHGPNEYLIELTHTIPGAEPVTFKQIARTRTEGDRTLIASITKTP